MNPWKAKLLDLLRSILRFSLWIVLVVNGLLLGVFSIYFTARFLRHLRAWLDRVLFDEPW
ncbi:MAG: hypothetical protein IID41_03725 [Planctomycetes bacterium]|nr:hypothetical protein [Planctomycetota bacterium]